MSTQYLQLLYWLKNQFLILVLLRQNEIECVNKFQKQQEQLYIQIMQNQFQSQIDVLFNDLYQFTCSYSYFQNGKHEDHATFEVFFRKYPFAGEYTVFAGLEAVRHFLNSFRITQQHQDFLRKTLPELSQSYLQWIRQDFRSSIKVSSFKEGSVVFAKEPLVSYSGPLGFIQLLETPILNLVGFASLVATNANRMANAVSPKECLEFGLRRAQGPNGGLSATIYSYLGGFAGTSNTKASQLFDIPCVGSMSHAYITSFTSLQDVSNFQINGVDIKARAIQIRKQYGWKTHDGQLAAFLGFAKTFPNNFKTLIDTYSTLESGLSNTIAVGKALIEAQITNIGIRLDSGDLCQLSKDCRSIWNKYVPQHKLLILASDDLNEQRLIEMEKNHSEIDVYAVGTNIVTCKKQPALGLVCKLTEINGISKMKLSSDPEKATFPGKKVVYRIWNEGSDKAAADLLALEGEEISLGHQVFHELHNKAEYQVVKIERLNNILDISTASQTIKQSKKYVQESIAALPASIFKLQSPSKYKVLFTPKFYQNWQNTISSNTLQKS